MAAQARATSTLTSVIIGGPLLAANRALLAAGVRTRTDGWRRAAGQVLQGEEATFVLSAFGLNAWPGGTRPAAPTVEQTRAHIGARLGAFLGGEPECRVCLHRRGVEHRAEPCAGGSYTLAFAPWVDGPGRFAMPAPQSWHGGVWPVEGDTPGTSRLINALVRINADGTACDAWLRINHAGADGVPMQELLTRLEEAWGRAAESPVVFPTPESFAPFEVAHPAPGRTGIAQVQFFADFAPLLAWRKRRNATLSETMTVSAALLWHLSRVPEFRQRRIGTTVEVGAVEGLARGVGVVVVRPADYTPRRGGLARFVRDFNRQLDLNRRRESDGCKTLDAAALMPAPLGSGLLRAVLTRTTTAFGSMGVTMLRDARVFGAPLGAVGHEHGFIAVGSVALPSTDGRTVGCVTAKGPREAITEYPRLVRGAIAPEALDAW